MKEIHRGDIFYANLGKNSGSEQLGVRPVLIIQNNIGNIHSSTTIISPISTRKKTKVKLPTHIDITNTKNIRKNSIVLLEQIRVIDIKRLRKYIGVVEPNDMKKIDKAIRISLDI